MPLSYCLPLPLAPALFFFFLLFFLGLSTLTFTTKSLTCFEFTYGMPPAVLIPLIPPRPSASGAKLCTYMHMDVSSNQMSCTAIHLVAATFSSFTLKMYLALLGPSPLTSHDRTRSTTGSTGMPFFAFDLALM